MKLISSFSISGNLRFIRERYQFGIESESMGTPERSNLNRMSRIRNQDTHNSNTRNKRDSLCILYSKFGFSYPDKGDLRFEGF